MAHLEQRQKESESGLDLNKCFNAFMQKETIELNCEKCECKEQEMQVDL